MSWMLRTLSLLIAMAAMPLATAANDVETDLPVSDISVSTSLDANAPQSFLLSDIDAMNSSSQGTEEQEHITHIAEPGTVGLLALAGLMGGAIAMRRRLG